MKTVQLTSEGLENLQRELQALTQVKKPQSIERLHKARSMGDLSENSEYTAAKEELAFVEGRILEIEEILKNAQVVQKNGKSHVVDVGVSVVVETNGKNDLFHIVGEFEADPMNKKVSHSSPIGKAMLGKKVGDTVEVQIPAGKTYYKIIEIK